MLQKIVLHLARTAEHPEGSSRHGYELTAPLDETGHLDAKTWKDDRALCRVRRFWEGEPDRIGYLVHRAGGAAGATWLIDYDSSSTEDDEAGYRLNSRRLIEGEYVSIRDADDTLHTFKIVQVSKP